MKCCFKSNMEVAKKSESIVDKLAFHLYTAKTYAVLALSLKSPYYLRKARLQLALFYKTKKEEQTITINKFYLVG